MLVNFDIRIKLGSMLYNRLPVGISEATGVGHLHGLHLMSGRKMIRSLAVGSNISTRVLCGIY